MKNLILLGLVLLTGSLFAQPDFPPEEDGPHHEKIMAARIGFITEKLELTSEEAMKFWPVFNEFDAKKKAIRKAYKPTVKPDEMNEQQANAFLDNMLKAKEEQLALEKEYLNKFKEVLPVKKVVKLGRVEHQFKQKLLNRMHRDKGMHRGPHHKGEKPPKE